MLCISGIVNALYELMLNWKMNTWIMALIGIISLCLQTILKTRQHCHRGANLGHEIKWNISQWKPESVLFSGVRLSLRIQGWALKNLRGSMLSASLVVPSVEKCEKNGAKRQSNGAPALGPLQVRNEILMLRLSIELSDFMCLLFWCVWFHWLV